MLERDFLPAPQTTQSGCCCGRTGRKLWPRDQSQSWETEQNTKALPRLGVGDCLLIQNQVGNYPSRWDITGQVVEVKP